MSSRYIPELDGLRAIAAIAVVAFHVRLPAVPGGFLGVDVFFVLSGYLTASIAIGGRYTLAEFMARRLRRLWPLLLCVSVFVAAFLAFFGDLAAIEIVPGALFLGNLSTAYLEADGALIHAWTLGAEMQFYALVAILALTFRRPTFRAVCAALFVAVTAARIGQAVSGDWRLGFYSPFAHSSGLFLGAVLATLPLDRLRAPVAIFVASAAVCCAAFALAQFRTIGALMLWISLAEIASAGMIAASVRGIGPAGVFLRSPPMRALGVLSFGIYLWHYPIAFFIRDAFDPLTAFAITLGASAILAAISFRLVEEPFRTGIRGNAGASSLSAEGA